MCAESVGEIFAFQLRGEVQGKKQVCVSSTAWADQTPPGAWQTLSIPYRKRFYAFTAPVRGGKVPVALQSRLGGKEKRTEARSLTEQVILARRSGFLPAHACQKVNGGFLRLDV
jgi:hypothetical protein